MTEKPRETQAELHVVELKEKVNNSSLMKHRNRSDWIGIACSQKLPRINSDLTP